MSVFFRQEIWTATVNCELLMWKRLLALRFKLPTACKTHLGTQRCRKRLKWVWLSLSQWQSSSEYWMTNGCTVCSLHLLEKSVPSPPTPNTLCGIIAWRYGRYHYVRNLQWMNSTHVSTPFVCGPRCSQCCIIPVARFPLQNIFVCTTCNCENNSKLIREHRYCYNSKKGWMLFVAL